MHISRYREKTHYQLLHVYYRHQEILDAVVWLGSAHGPRAGYAVRLVRFGDGHQLRMYFSAVAYTLLVTLRRLGLAGTELASARCDTVRLKLLKVGALVRVTVRRVWVSLSEAYSYRRLFERAVANLSQLTPRPRLC